MSHTDQLTPPQVADERIFKLGFVKIGAIALLIVLGISLLSSNPGTEPSPLNDKVGADEKGALITAPTDFENIRIKNFGQMDDHFYRGARPKPEDYKTLAALGIKTVIDLQDEPNGYEKPSAQAAGIKYINIPMDDKSQPNDDKVETFLSVAKDNSNWPFYVHCKGGRHRTGLIGAVYRFNNYGWDYEKAYEEMKNYDYYSRWGHTPIKEYVESYFKRMKAQKPFVPAADPHGVKPESEPVTAPPPPQPDE